MLYAIQWLIFFQAVLYFTGADNWISIELNTSLQPKYWYLLTMATVLALIALRPWILRDLPRAILIWLWVYVCYGLFSFLISSQSIVVIGVLKNFLIMTSLLAAFLIMLQIEGAMRKVQLALLISTLFSVLMIIVDYVEPTWTVSPGRAAGLFYEPNMAAQVLVFAMTLSIQLLPRALRSFYCIFVGFGVLITFSRTGWLLWPLAMIGLSLMGYVGFKRRVFAVSSIGLLAIFFTYILFSGNISVFFTVTGLDAYWTTYTSTRLGLSGEEVMLVGVDDRFAQYKEAFILFKEYPWFGHGLGYGYEWSSDLPRHWGFGFYGRPHNMYLQALMEGGIFALSIFIALLIVLWKSTNPAGRVFVILLSVGSMFLHTNLEIPVLILMIALVTMTRKSTERLIEDQSIPSLETKNASIYR